MYHVSAQGIDERMINVHYYYYKLFYIWCINAVTYIVTRNTTEDKPCCSCSVIVTKYLAHVCLLSWSVFTADSDSDFVLLFSTQKIS